MTDDKTLSAADVPFLAGMLLFSTGFGYYIYRGLLWLYDKNGGLGLAGGAILVGFFLMSLSVILDEPPDSY